MPDILDFWPEDSKDRKSKGFAIPLKDKKGRIVGYGYPNLNEDDVNTFRKKANKNTVLDDPWGDF